MPDVKQVVTKDFTRPGNRLMVVGRIDPEVLGGSVYADCYGQRGDRLFEAGDAASLKRLWDALLRAHRQGAYLSGSAIAEGGAMLRLFEASYGSGLGARVSLDMPGTGRRDGILFGEFVGSVLLEVSADFDPERSLDKLPYFVLGETTETASLTITQKGEKVWQNATLSLAEKWSSTFGEVVK
jgi:phosphoribosylformylglycinamidine synthase